MEYLGRNTERFKTVQVLNDLTVEKVLFVSNINNTYPTAGQILTWDGTMITWKDDSNTTYVAATSSVLGLLKIEDDTEQSVAANSVTATAGRTYGIQFNSSDQAVVNVPWTDTDTTYSMMTDSVLGLGKLEDNTTQTTAANAVTTTASRTYGIQKNSSNQLVVNVPWTDTTYTLPLATTSVRGGVELGSDTDLTETYETGVTGASGKTYPVQLNAANQMGVSVPWTDTTYTLPQATATARGGVELFSNTVQSVAGTAVSATASRTYGVQLNSDDQMVVNVPWVDTDTKVTLNGTTLNGVATFASTDTLDIESTLIYDSETLTIGEDDNGQAIIQRQAHSDGNGGKLEIRSGHATHGQTDKSGGDLYLTAGAPTGNASPGTIQFFGSTPVAGSGTGLIAPRPLAVFDPEAGGNEFIFFEPYDGDEEYFKIQVRGDGVTNLSTYDNGGSAATLTISPDGPLILSSSGNMSLDSSADIDLSADGGNITFKDGSTLHAEFDFGEPALNLYGQSGDTGRLQLYEDSDNGTDYISLRPPQSVATNRVIEFPDANGTVQLQGENTGQVMHFTLDNPGSYVFYLYNDDYWYSYGTTSLALLGNSSAPGNISSGNSKYQGRVAAYTAPSNCVIKKVGLNFFWSSSVVNSADFDFGFSKFTPITGGTAASITMNAITATDHNGSYTENAPYYKEFTLSGGNASLSAGDSFAMHMRTTGGSSAQRVFVYGTMTVYLELT